MSKDDVARRLAKLDPERRKIVERLLAAKNDSDPVQIPAFEDEALAAFQSPGRRAKSATRKFYNAVNGQLNATEFGGYSAFLNYGYVADNSEEASHVQLPQRMLNRNSVKLALEVIGDCDLAGRRVLDVGCGRGGTLTVINRFFTAGMKVGLDLSSAAIRFSRTAHRQRDTFFLEGDAEQLPFCESAFDVVVNVESSHSYPQVQAFFAEVHRVLAPGGAFLYTDMLEIQRFDAHVVELERLGFAIEQRRDITRNVLLACAQTAELRSRAFAATAERTIIQDFLGTPGSSVFEQMERGRAAYRILRMRKD